MQNLKRIVFNVLRVFFIWKEVFENVGDFEAIHKETLY